MEFMTEMERTVSCLREINGIALEDGQIITQVLMSLPPSLKLNFEVAWDSTTAQEKTLKNLTTRLVKMEKNVKQSEEESSSNALVSMRASENKNSGEAEEKTLPVRDNKLKRGNEEKRRCWECGDDPHVRAKCRIFKRRLEREEDDRDNKRRRYEPTNRNNNRHYDRNPESRDKRHDNRNRRDEKRGRRDHSYSAMQSRDNDNDNKQ